MKKLLITTAIVLGLGLTTFANPVGGGMFNRGNSEEGYYGMGDRTTNIPMLPTHDQLGNQNAPLGSGIAVLLGLGAAYLVGKKNKEE